MTPRIMTSPMTGKTYVVTRFRKDGSAALKYDVTADVEALIQDRTKTLEKDLEEECQHSTNLELRVRNMEQALAEYADNDQCARKFWYSVPTTECECLWCRAKAALREEEACQKKGAEGKPSPAPST